MGSDVVSETHVRSRPRRPRHRRPAVALAVLGGLVVVTVGVVVVVGAHLGPLDRPSLAELHAIGAKLEDRCPETRHFGGSQIDLLRGRVREPLFLADETLTERERSFVDNDTSGCNIGPAIT